MKIGTKFYWESFDETWELVGDTDELKPTGRYNLKLIKGGNYYMPRHLFFCNSLNCKSIAIELAKMTRVKE